MGSYGAKIRRVIYLICRNRINLIVKNMPTSLIIKYIPLLVLGRARDLAIPASEGAFFDGVSGVFASLKQLFVMLAKRKVIQMSRKISGHDLQKLFDFKESAITPPRLAAGIQRTLAEGG